VTPAIDPALFRDAIGRFATGVTVMTTLHDGEPHGMTANAVSSVSLEPVLVLVCVDQGTEMCRLVRESGVFALSILAAEQRDVSERFADPQRPLGDEMFAGIGTTTGVTGSPILTGTLAHLDCRVWAIHPGGDHDIVVGEVVGVGVDDGRTGALTYFRSRYGSTVDGTGMQAG